MVRTVRGCGWCGNERVPYGSRRQHAAGHPGTERLERTQQRPRDAIREALRRDYAGTSTYEDKVFGFGTGKPSAFRPSR